MFAVFAHNCIKLARLVEQIADAPDPIEDIFL